MKENIPGILEDFLHSRSKRNLNRDFFDLYLWLRTPPTGELMWLCSTPVIEWISITAALNGYVTGMIWLNYWISDSCAYTGHKLSWVMSLYVHRPILLFRVLSVSSVNRFEWWLVGIQLTKVRKCRNCVTKSIVNYLGMDITQFVSVAFGFGSHVTLCVLGMCFS